MKVLITSNTINRFTTFVERAESILSLERTLASTSSESTLRRPISEFESFLAKAEPILAQEVRKILGEHRQQLKNVFRWLASPSCDVLAAAGLSGDENSYTNLVKWLLWPAGEAQLSLRCQKAWLEALGLHEISKQLNFAVEPAVQFVTHDGRPDMVLHFEHPDFILIVEAKIGTEEHLTPSSQMQTQSYPAAARSKLGLSKDHPGAMVYLTRDDLKAADPSAINTTFERLVLSISQAISPDELSNELRHAYSFVITHLMTYAAPGGVDKACILLELANYYQGSEHLSDEKIINNLNVLGPLCRSLQVGSTR